MALNPVQKWLQSILGPYRHAQEVYADVDRTLHAVPTLSPRTDTYTYDDGRTVLLLTLQGTIPISFRGNTYNIPIAYWIPHAYPREPPIAYVVPASNMLVKQSSSVDLSGLITAGVLQSWARKWEGNNLLQLTETLQSIFSREPPLYAKPAQPPATNGQSLSVQSSYSPGSSQPRPPHQGPRPPPAPPIAASSSHQSPGPASSSSSSYTNRQSSMSPSQLQPQINPSSSQGPPLRPQKKTWLNGQASPAGPPAGQYVNDHHHRSASTSSIQQAQVAPQGYVTPYNGAQQHPQQQQQQPPRPPHPQALEHSRSPSMGLPMRQPSLHVQASSLQPPFSPQQSSQGQYRPQQQQQQHYQLSPGSAAGPSFQPSPASPPPFSGQPKNITAQQHQATSHFSASSMNPQASQAPFQVQHYHHQSQSQRQPFASSSHANQPVPANPPAPYIPPRPDGLRQGTSSPAGTVAPRVLSTPINILDEDNEPSAASTSASTTQAPPPRPTNPALLSLRRALYTQLLHHLHTLQAHLNNENTHLNALHEDLLKGEPAITDEMQRLEAVRDVCLSVRDRMQEVVSSAERNIHDLSTRPETEVDELICGTNVVHNQLLELVAEDNAIEDAIYHLGRYFNSDTRTQNELERFLKRTRILARDQFMKRAMINKILLEIALSRAQRS